MGDGAEPRSSGALVQAHVIICMIRAQAAAPSIELSRRPQPTTIIKQPAHTPTRIICTSPQASIVPPS
jgi:hypothetical protein